MSREVLELCWSGIGGVWRLYPKTGESMFELLAYSAHIYFLTITNTMYSVHFNKDLLRVEGSSKSCSVKYSHHALPVRTSIKPPYSTSL